AATPARIESGAVADPAPSKSLLVLRRLDRTALRRERVDRPRSARESGHGGSAGGVPGRHGDPSLEELRLLGARPEREAAARAGRHGLRLLQLRRARAREDID